jgi:hypothetical protein
VPVAPGRRTRSSRCDDAPAAVVGRDFDGHWHLGGLALEPLSPQLATDQRGPTLDVLGARF